MTDNAAGWQPDPTGKHDHRYWDGTQWTDNVADAGVAGTDPYEAPAPEPAAEAPAPEAPAPEAEPTAVTPAPVDAGTEPTAVTPVAAADTTAAWSTTPTPPAAPPPYVPPAPVAGDGAGGGGSSKRGLLIGGGILAVIAIVVAVLLSQGDDETDIRAELASKIADEARDSGTAISDDQAECVADLVVDAAGEDAFKDTNFNADDPPAEFIEAILEVGPQALVDECGLSEEQAFGGDGGSTDDGGDDGSTDEGELEGLRDDCADGDFGACDDLYFSAEFGSDLEEFGSTCGGIAEPQGGFCEETNGGETSSSGGLTDGFSDGNMEDIITESYRDAFGISEDKARCLAEKVTEAMDAGTLDEEDAMTEIFDYLEDCDISMEEISGN